MRDSYFCLVTPLYLPLCERRLVKSLTGKHANARKNARAKCYLAPRQSAESGCLPFGKGFASTLSFSKTEPFPFWGIFANDALTTAIALSQEFIRLPTTDCRSSMSLEKLLEILETAPNEKELSQVQELVLRQVWEGKTYAEIASAADSNSDYIKSVGSQLWHSLSEVLGEPVTQRNFRSFIKRRMASPALVETRFIASEASPDIRDKSRLALSRIFPIPNPQSPILGGNARHFLFLRAPQRNDSPGKMDSARQVPVGVRLGDGGCRQNCFDRTLC